MSVGAVGDGDGAVGSIVEIERPVDPDDLRLGMPQL